MTLAPDEFIRRLLAPVPSEARSSRGSHETPVENVRKIQWYDHLLRSNGEQGAQGE